MSTGAFQRVIWIRISVIQDHSDHDTDEFISGHGLIGFFLMRDVLSELRSLITPKKRTRVYTCCLDYETATYCPIMSCWTPKLLTNTTCRIHSFTFSDKILQ